MGEVWRMQGEREKVKAVYPNQVWALKVDKMDDAQVFAIYSKFLKEGKIK